MGKVIADCTREIELIGCYLGDYGHDGGGYFGGVAK